MTRSLNPYSTGIWSATTIEVVETEENEDVLILILLEYGLRPLKMRARPGFHCLNPYSTGIWSATLCDKEQ